MSGELLTDFELKRVLRPARQWRNRWRALAAIEALYEDGSVGSLDANAAFWMGVFPTRDVAETVAVSLNHWPITYLGAFPVEGDEQPNT